MYLNYFWRTKRILQNDLVSSQIVLDLVWTSREQKIMVVGSTMSETLFLYSVAFDKTDPLDYEMVLRSFLMPG
jgi:hypothetical protein